MAITAAMVKELREMTGAGMMDCKKALTATDGDMDKSVEWLREKGLATAQKKAGRIAAEGIVMLLTKNDDKKAVAVEVNSETDFVAKNDTFRDYVAQVCEQAIETTAADIDAFLAEPWKFDTTKTVKEALAAQISVIGENMNIRRFQTLEEENGFVSAYTHMGGKIGVLVDVETDVVNDAIKEMGKNIAMQIAAMNPQYVSRSDMSDEEVAKLREITVGSALNTPDTLPKPILTQLLNKASEDGLFSADDAAAYEEQKNNLNYLFNFLSAEAKAAVAGLAVAAKEAIASNKIFSGLVEGRVSKQLKEMCLLDQTYVKAEDGKQSVANYVASVAKENGAKINVKCFVRFETGEGIEKKQEDFAAEVAAQMAGK